MAEQPWYKNGLQFECSQCGDCCTGAPGYVWVNKAEVEALAAHQGMTVDEFQQRFVRKAGIRQTLAERDNGDCIFFDGKLRKCTVYEHRPRQCRTWPFWDSNLRTEQDWKRTCEVCPGSGKGQIVPLESIQKQLAVIRV